MSTYYYIGLDIHKRTISYCIKAIDGSLIGQGKIEADRKSLDEWAKGLPGPWVGAMEATIFTGWVYDFLKPYAVDLKVAHPEMLKAITAAKKKNDRADAEKIADLLRVNLLPECHMLSEEIRELRRVLRYRNHIVRTAVKMQNKISGLLMEVGVNYSKRRIHGEKYFHEILERVEGIPPSVKELLKLSRSSYEMFRTFQKRLVETLRTNTLIHDRVQRLMTIPGVGEITALTWVLEIGDPRPPLSLETILIVRFFLPLFIASITVITGSATPTASSTCSLKRLVSTIDNRPHLRLLSTCPTLSCARHHSTGDSWSSGTCRARPSFFRTQ